MAATWTPPTTPLSTSGYGSELLAQYQLQPSDVQAQIQARTGVDTTNQTVQSGIAAAAGLIQNGYDPNNPDDNAALVHSISAGLCLIPPPFPGVILAGAIEGLWVVGNQIACPVANAFAAIGLGSRCDAPPCTTTGGPFTTAGILQTNQGALPPLFSRDGSFAQLATAMLVTGAAQAGNCNPGPPAVALIDAAVSVWNATRKGPAVPIYVPALLVQPGTGSPGIGRLFDCAGAQISGSDPAALAGLPENIFYAFDGLGNAQGAYGITSGVPSFPSCGMVGTEVVPARSVMINIGDLIKPQKSTGQVVAESGASLLVGGLAGGLLFSWVSGQAASVVFDGAWAHLVGLFRASPPRVPGLREVRKIQRKGRR